MGYLTKDPQQKSINGVASLVIVNIAYNHKYKNAYGEQVEKPLFIDANLWGRLGEIAWQYTHRGSKVLIEGRLDMDEWTDQYGKKRQKYSIATESIKLLDNKPREDKAQNSQSAQEVSKEPKNIPKSNLEIQIDDDEIPF